MGYFTWKTADTGQTIWNEESRQGARTTYLLQPGGQPPLREDSYEGYGVFGGVDAYAWLARQNLPAEQTEGRSDNDLRDEGIKLFFDQGKPGVPRVERPLKFSFDANAEYAMLAASPDCPTQGFDGGRHGCNDDDEDEIEYLDDAA